MKTPVQDQNHSTPLSCADTKYRLKYKKIKRKLKREKEKRKSAEKLLADYRSGLICSICSDLFALPFMLQCGHSFCFDCVYSWFSSSAAASAKSSDTPAPCSCPLCRAVISSAPVENILLAGQLDTYLSSSLSDKTVSSHANSSYLDRVKNSRLAFERNGGQRDCWRSFLIQECLFDELDETARCPHCLWEVVGGECANCGEAFAENGEEDEEGDDFMDSCPEDDRDDEYDSDLSDFIVHDDEEIEQDDNEDDEDEPSESETISSTASLPPTVSRKSKDSGNSKKRRKRTSLVIEDEDDDDS